MVGHLPPQQRFWRRGLQSIHNRETDNTTSVKMASSNDDNLAGLYLLCNLFYHTSNTP